MEQRRRALVAGAATVGLFLLVQVGALALVQPFDAAGMQAFEDPQDPTNSLLYVVLILVATVGMLAAFRYGGEQVVRLTIVGTAGLLSWYVFVVLLPSEPAVAGVSLPAALPAAAIAVALWAYPEWYVIDGAGVVMGAAAAGLFGVSFGLLPALVLLVVLAVYDAVSVYGTEHMLTLAEGVMGLKVPVLLVIPTTLSYSYLDAVEAAEAEADEAESAGDAESQNPDGPDGTAAEDGTPPEGEVGADSTAEDGTPAEDATPADSPADAGPLERDALFIGLGDAVIPTVLVASAAVFLEAPALPVVGLSAPVAGAMVGSVLGLVGLLYMVFEGRAHAGLPLLNGGTILGYLVGAVAVGVPLSAALGL
jgi:presenilin-like A22 family membrane protease